MIIIAYLAYIPDNAIFSQITYNQSITFIAYLAFPRGH